MGHVASSGDDEILDDLANRREAGPEALGATLEERLAAQGQSAVEPVLRYPKPGKKRADGRPRGARRGQADVKRDVDQVAKFLAEGKPRWWIVQHYGARKVPARTVDNWISFVRQRWQDTLKDELPTLREKLVNQMRKARQQCLSGDEPDHTNARLYFREEINLLGLAAPEKHDVRALVAVAQAPAEVDPGELLRAEGVSDEQLRVITDVARGLTQKRAGGLPMLETTLVEGNE